jgi:succinate dehydrogenase/fumarate reductase flavoprotein subunit
MQEIAAEKVGVLRTGAALQEAVDRLDQLRRHELPRLASRAKDRRYNREWIECLQAESMLATLQAIARSALLREESRGAHYRRDYPQTDNERWLRNTVLRQRGEDLEIGTAPVRRTKLRVNSEAAGSS